MRDACYKCQYRGTIENSRHSKCQHPEAEKIMQSSGLLDILFEHLVMERTIPRLTQIIVKFADQGLEGGYVHFPMNFDPIWLESCNCYKEI